MHLEGLSGDDVLVKAPEVSNDLSGDAVLVETPEVSNGPEKSYQLEVEALRQSTQIRVHAELSVLQDTLADGFTFKEACDHLDSCFYRDTVNIYDSDVVFCVQVILKEKGLYNGDLDGRFGRITKACVKKLQSDLGFNGSDVDGIFGSFTLGHLLGKNPDSYPATLETRSNRFLSKPKVSVNAASSIPETFKRNGFILKELSDDFFSFVPKESWTLGIDSQNALQIYNSIKSSITNLFLDENPLTPKQRYKAFLRLVPQLRELLEIYRRVDSRLPNYKRGFSSLRKILRLTNSKLPRSDQDRDSALMQSFDIPVVEAGAHRLIKSLSPILSIQQKISSGERLNKSEKVSVKESLIFFARDRIATNIVLKAPNYLEDIDFLMSHVGDASKVILLNLKKFIESSVQLSKFARKIVASNDPGVISSICLKAGPALLSLTVAVVAIGAAPITGGTSLAVAGNFLLASAAGVVASEVGNIASDRVGRGAYGELYDTQSFLDGYLTGDIDGQELISIYGREFLIGLAFDFGALKGARSLKFNLLKLFSALKAAPKMQAVFIKQIRSLRFSGSNSPLTRSQSQNLLGFVSKLSGSISDQSFNDAITLLISQSLWLAKGSGLHKKLGINLNLVNLTSPESGRNLRFEYNVSQSEAPKLLSKLNDLQSYSVSTTAERAVATLDAAGRKIELVFNFKQENVEFLKCINSISDASANSEYQVQGLEDGFLIINKTDSGTIDMPQKLILLGYNLSEIENPDSKVSDYLVTRDDPLTNQKIRIVNVGRGFDAHS